MRELDFTATIENSKSRKGRETQKQILESALHTFIEYGYGEFSIQRVADKCGLSRGNVSYYYATRNDLLHDLLQVVVKGYIDEFDDIAKDVDLSAEEKFLSIVNTIMSDLSTEETSKFFPELWALSNRNEAAQEEMNALYEKAREHIIELIGAMNPKLNADERELVGLFISASMEGHTPFVGKGKEWEGELPSLTNIAAYSFLTLAKTISPKQIKNISTFLKKI